MANEFVGKVLHPLVHMRDALTAHSWLSRCGHEEVHLCPCCLRMGQDHCPYRGSERTGVCDHYVLDERDPVATEARAMEAIHTHAGRWVARLTIGAPS